MGRRLDTDHDRPFRVETCYTNDAIVPRFFGSDIGRDGWRSVPVPPADPAKEDWDDPRSPARDRLHALGAHLPGLLADGAPRRRRAGGREAAPHQGAR
jgi:hypothetical protein